MAIPVNQVIISLDVCVRSLTLDEITASRNGIETPEDFRAKHGRNETPAELRAREDLQDCRTRLARIGEQIADLKAHAPENLRAAVAELGAAWDQVTAVTSTETPSQPGLLQTLVAKTRAVYLQSQQRATDPAQARTPNAGANAVTSDEPEAVVRWRRLEASARHQSLYESHPLWLGLLRETFQRVQDGRLGADLREAHESYLLVEQRAVEKLLLIDCAHEMTPEAFLYVMQSGFRIESPSERLHLAKKLKTSTAFIEWLRVLAARYSFNISVDDINGANVAYLNRAVSLPDKLFRIFSTSLSREFVQLFEARNSRTEQEIADALARILSIIPPESVLTLHQMLQGIGPETVAQLVLGGESATMDAVQAEISVIIRQMHTVSGATRVHRTAYTDLFGLSQQSLPSAQQAYLNAHLRFAQGRFDEVKDYLNGLTTDEIAAWIKPLSSSPNTAALIFSFLIKLWKDEQIELFFRVFNKLEPALRDQTALNLLQVFFEQRCWQQAYDWISRIPVQRERDLATDRLFMEASAEHETSWQRLGELLPKKSEDSAFWSFANDMQAGRVEEALRSTEEPSPEMRPARLQRFLRCFPHRYANARAFYDTLDPSLRPRVLPSLIQGLQEGGQMASLADLLAELPLEEIAAAMRPLQGDKLSETSFYAAKALCEAGHCLQAFALALKFTGMFNRSEIMRLAISQLDCPPASIQSIVDALDPDERTTNMPWIFAAWMACDQIPQARELVLRCMEHDRFELMRKYLIEFYDGDPQKLYAAHPLARDLFQEIELLLLVDQQKYAEAVPSFLALTADERRATFARMLQLQPQVQALAHAAEFCMQLPPEVRLMQQWAAAYSSFRTPPEGCSLRERSLRTEERINFPHALLQAIVTDAIQRHAFDEAAQFIFASQAEKCDYSSVYLLCFQQPHFAALWDWIKQNKFPAEAAGAFILQLFNPRDTSAAGLTPHQSAVVSFFAGLPPAQIEELEFDLPSMSYCSLACFVSRQRACVRNALTLLMQRNYKLIASSDWLTNLKAVLRHLGTSPASVEIVRALLPLESCLADEGRDIEAFGHFALCFRVGLVELALQAIEPGKLQEVLNRYVEQVGRQSYPLVFYHAHSEEAQALLRPFAVYQLLGAKQYPGAAELYAAMSAPEQLDVFQRFATNASDPNALVSAADFCMLLPPEIRPIGQWATLYRSGDASTLSHPIMLEVAKDAVQHSDFGAAAQFMYGLSDGLECGSVLSFCAEEPQFTTLCGWMRRERWGPAQAEFLTRLFDPGQIVGDSFTAHQTEIASFFARLSPAQALAFTGSFSARASLLECLLLFASQSRECGLNAFIVLIQPACRQWSRMLHPAMSHLRNVPPSSFDSVQKLLPRLEAMTDSARCYYADWHFGFYLQMGQIALAMQVAGRGKLIKTWAQCKEAVGALVSKKAFYDTHPDGSHPMLRVLETYDKLENRRYAQATLSFASLTPELQAEVVSSVAWPTATEFYMQLPEGSRNPAAWVESYCMRSRSPTPTPLLNAMLAHLLQLHDFERICRCLSDSRGTAGIDLAPCLDEPHFTAICTWIQTSPDPLANSDFLYHLFKASFSPTDSSLTERLMQALPAGLAVRFMPQVATHYATSPQHQPLAAALVQKYPIHKDDSRSWGHVDLFEELYCTVKATQDTALLNRWLLLCANASNARGLITRCIQDNCFEAAARCAYLARTAGHRVSLDDQLSSHWGIRHSDRRWATADEVAAYNRAMLARYNTVPEAARLAIFCEVLSDYLLSARMEVGIRMVQALLSHPALLEEALMRLPQDATLSQRLQTIAEAFPGEQRSTFVQIAVPLFIKRSMAHVAFSTLFPCEHHVQLTLLPSIFDAFLKNRDYVSFMKALDQLKDVKVRAYFLTQALMQQQLQLTEAVITWSNAVFRRARLCLGPHNLAPAFRLGTFSNLTLAAQATAIHAALIRESTQFLDRAARFQGTEACVTSLPPLPVVCQAMLLRDWMQEHSVQLPIPVRSATPAPQSTGNVAKNPSPHSASPSIRVVPKTPPQVSPSVPNASAPKVVTSPVDQRAKILLDCLAHVVNGDLTAAKQCMDVLPQPLQERYLTALIKHARMHPSLAAQRAFSSSVSNNVHIRALNDVIRDRSSPVMQSPHLAELLTAWMSKLPDAVPSEAPTKETAHPLLRSTLMLLQRPAIQKSSSMVS